MLRLNYSKQYLGGEQRGALLWFLSWHKMCYYARHAGLLF